MIKSKFEGATIRSAGLFPSARHEWQRFHSTDVPCHVEGCYGHLKWMPTSKQELWCTECRTIFSIRKKVHVKEEKESSRLVRLED